MHSDGLEVAGHGSFWYVSRVKVTAGGKRTGKMMKAFAPKTTREAVEKELADYRRQRDG